MFATTRSALSEGDVASTHAGEAAPPGCGLERRAPLPYGVAERSFSTARASYAGRLMLSTVSVAATVGRGCSVMTLSPSQASVDAPPTVRRGRPSHALLVDLLLCAEPDSVSYSTARAFLVELAPRGGSSCSCSVADKPNMEDTLPLSWTLAGEVSVAHLPLDVPARAVVGEASAPVAWPNLVAVVIATAAAG
jgi:hypothetical protein